MVVGCQGNRTILGFKFPGTGLYGKKVIDETSVTPIFIQCVSFVDTQRAEFFEFP